MLLGRVGVGGVTLAGVGVPVAGGHDVWGLGLVDGGDGVVSGTGVVASGPATEPLQPAAASTTTADKPIMVRIARPLSRRRLATQLLDSGGDLNEHDDDHHRCGRNGSMNRHRVTERSFESDTANLTFNAAPNTRRFSQRTHLGGHFRRPHLWLSSFRICRNRSGEEAARAAGLWLLHPAMCVHDTVAHGQPNDEVGGHQRQGAEQ